MLRFRKATQAYHFSSAIVGDFNGMSLTLLKRKILLQQTFGFSSKVLHTMRTHVHETNT